MKSTDAAITGHFAYYLCSALELRPLAPPIVMEIMAPSACIKDFIILLKNQGWQTLGDVKATGLQKRLAKRIHVFVHGTYMIALCATWKENLLPCALSRESSVLSCLVTPTKVSNDSSVFCIQVGH